MNAVMDLRYRRTFFFVSVVSATMGSAAGKNNETFPSYTRRAHHAGSWYESNSKALNATLQRFLDVAVTSDSPPSSSSSSSFPSSPENLRSVIVPHAGYSYSGPTAAYAYQAIHEELSKSLLACPISTILVLHPSHHVYLSGCAVSGANQLETPVGNLRVDHSLRQEILKLSPRFTVMEQSVDEAEHSGEMQYPYLAKILSDLGRLHDITVLPVMCGALSVSQEASYGNALAEIIARPSVLTVVSTDFCHWGSRFSFQPTTSGSKQALKIHEFIEQLDRRGMDLIELQQPGAFADYLKETRNTICGRHAIAVWLRAVTSVYDESQLESGDKNGSDLKVKFVKYAQSSPATSMADSSVSYAAAIATTTGAS